MIRARVISAATAAVLAAGMPHCQATDGYFSHGYGARSKAMAGATVAHPQDAFATSTNPAGMVFVGSRFDIGAALFAPTRQYSVTGSPSGAPGTFGLAAGSVESGKSAFFIPDIAYNRMLSASSSLGLTLDGNGGMNTTYPGDAGGDGTYHAGGAGVNLEQLFVHLNYAQKLSEKTAAGISLIYANQRFRCSGLASFGGFVSDGNPDSLTNRGKDVATGFGYRLGLLHQADQKFSLGISYQPKLHMTKFDKYSDLFAQRGGFDIPGSATLGLAYKSSPNSIVTFDVKRIWYGGVASVSNPFSNLMTGMAGDVTSLLGGENGPGFGWRDMTILKAGIEWNQGKPWVWRAGISHARQPIPGSEMLFNILAPGVQEWHFTFGGSKQLENNSEFSFSLMYSPTKRISGANAMEAPGQQEIQLQMYQLEAEIGWTKRF